VRSSVGLLKINVERAELEVLQGLEPRDWPLVRQVAAQVRAVLTCMPARWARVLHALRSG
jgi:hypothetical protein